MKLPKIDKVAAVLLSFGLFFYIIISIPWMFQHWNSHVTLIKFREAHTYYQKDKCPVFVIDGCEYLSHVDNLLAHKGNCTNQIHINK